MSESQVSNDADKKELSPAMKYYLRNKANPYPCADCGRMTNKSVYKKHSTTQYHQLAVLLKHSKPKDYVDSLIS